jgi:serine phosphatase RsbU (regulator of sigma subunit)
MRIGNPLPHVHVNEQALVMCFVRRDQNSGWPECISTGTAESASLAILVSNGTLRRLESRNGILGCLSENAPSGSPDEVELVPGDRLILYTDGLVEVFNCLDNMLGVEGLEDLVLQSAKIPLADMQKTILDGVAAWRHGPLADDVSLVIAEVS